MAQKTETSGNIIYNEERVAEYGEEERRTKSRLERNWTDTND